MPARSFLRLPSLRRSRRAVLQAAVLAPLALAGLPSLAAAEDTQVPPELQAQLLSKVTAYWRDYQAKAGERARIAVLVRQGDLASMRASGFIKAALTKLSDLGGVPHEVEAFPYESAAALAARCKARGTSIVYLTAGFDDQLDAIKSAMEPLQLLTVTGIGDYVRRGIVLGFEVVSGRPRILVHRGQAKRQGIRLASELLKLATVYE